MVKPKSDNLNEAIVKVLCVIFQYFFFNFFLLSAMFGESPAWEESRQEEITLVEEEACQAVFYDFLR